MDSIALKRIKLRIDLDIDSDVDCPQQLVWFGVEESDDFKTISDMKRRLAAKLDIDWQTIDLVLDNGLLPDWSDIALIRDNDLIDIRPKVLTNGSVDSLKSINNSVSIPMPALKPRPMPTLVANKAPNPVPAPVLPPVPESVPMPVPASVPLKRSNGPPIGRQSVAERLVANHRQMSEIVGHKSVNKEFTEIKVEVKTSDNSVKRTETTDKRVRRSVKMPKKFENHFFI